MTEHKRKGGKNLQTGPSFFVCRRPAPPLSVCFAGKVPPTRWASWHASLPAPVSAVAQPSRDTKDDLGKPDDDIQRDARDDKIRADGDIGKLAAEKDVVAVGKNFHGEREERFEDRKEKNKKATKAADRSPGMPKGRLNARRRRPDEKAEQGDGRGRPHDDRHRRRGDEEQSVQDGERPLLPLCRFGEKTPFAAVYIKIFLHRNASLSLPLYHVPMQNCLTRILHESYIFVRFPSNHRKTEKQYIAVHMYIVAYLLKKGKYFPSLVAKRICLSPAQRKNAP